MATTNLASNVSRASLTTLLFNPSYYLAGALALGLGLALMLLTALIGSVGNTHLNGVIDVNIGHRAAPWVFFAEGLIDWLSLAVPLYVAGRFLSRSRNVRALDVFGTQALARAPMLLAMVASLLPGFQRASARLHTGLNTEGARPPLASLAENPDVLIRIGVLVFAVLMLVWMVALMYRAYVSACNLKGARAVASFVVAFVVGELLSKAAIFTLLGDQITPAPPPG
jgi:hypothetical protein